MKWFYGFLMHLSSPVYVTQQRRNAAGVGLVMEADLDTTEHSSLWVLQVRALSTRIGLSTIFFIFVTRSCRGWRFVSTSLTKCCHLLNSKRKLD
jgi:hypothetical protein